VTDLRTHRLIRALDSIARGTAEPEKVCADCHQLDIGDPCPGCGWHVCLACHDDHACVSCDVCNRRLLVWEERLREAHYECAPDCRKDEPYHDYLRRQGLEGCERIVDWLEGGLRIGNCPVCHSTISIPLPLSAV
jgi:hypothetical protein